MAANPAATIDLKDTVITLRAGSKTYEVKISDGTLQYTVRTPHEYRKNRGRLDSVRLADEEAMEVRLDAEWQELSSTTSNNSLEVWLQSLTAADSVDAEKCNPVAFDIEMLVSKDCGDGVVGTLWTFPEFRIEERSGDVRAGTINMNGMCNVIQPVVQAATLSSAA